MIVCFHWLRVKDFHLYLSPSIKFVRVVNFSPVFLCEWERF